MKTTKIAILVLTIAVVLFILIPSLSWAGDDGAALFKAKCAMCHGAMGEGKVGPSLQKTSLTEKQIADLISNGAAGKKAPHSKGVAGINGYYDFKAVPNHGLDESNVVVTRWDAAAQTWAVVSDPLGIPRGQ